MKNIWILTEERPKIHIIKNILKLNYSFPDGGNSLIKPVFNGDKFTFKYQVEGIRIKSFENIFIKVVSGHSSFVDFLIFEKDTEPNKNDMPVFVVEETKTDDSESRNTNAYQRSSKFVYCDKFYDATIPKFMLFDIDKGRKIKGYNTHLFGMRMLTTIGVKLVGINQDSYPPFTNLEEFIEFKNKISNKGRKHNVPLTISKINENTIAISAKLDKGNGRHKHKISHDPNIGAVSIICLVLKKLGWEGDIKLTNHNLFRKNVANTCNSKIRGNKLLYIMKKLKVEFDNIDLDWNSIEDKIDYWYYDETSEKLASILYHLNVELNEELIVIFDNHAGCGKSYFTTPTGQIQVDKKTPLPDLVIFNENSNRMLVIEAEKAINIKKALKQVEGFDIFISRYIKKHYEGVEVTKAIITFGEIKNQMGVIYSLHNDGTIFSS